VSLPDGLDFGASISDQCFMRYSKTKTIVSSLVNLFHQKKRCLVCAPTNVAVVHVAERLLLHIAPEEANGRVVIVGDEQRMDLSEDLARFSLDTILLTQDMRATRGLRSTSSAAHRSSSVRCQARAAAA
jgi:hypothetical protein